MFQRNMTKRDKARESTIYFKKRRGKKEQEGNHQNTFGVKEGKSYETAVDMNNDICSNDICEISLSQTEQAC